MCVTGIVNDVLNEETHTTTSRRTLDDSLLVLGEGPAWNDDTSELSWIDIEEGVILVARLDGDLLSDVQRISVGEQVGCAIPIDRSRFLVGLRSQLAIVDRNGSIERSRDLLPDGLRFNDGKIDPQGRFVIGALNRSGPDGRQVLIRLEHSGEVTELDSDLNLSNGLAWSPDGKWMYNADTHDEVVYRRSYVDGVAGAREAFIAVGGRPDGITSDVDGNIWITVFDGERVDCYAPDGTLHADRTIPTPGYHPASVEFYGPELKRMAIATGYPRVRDHERLRYPRDGELLSVPAIIPGLATTPWRKALLPN